VVPFRREVYRQVAKDFARFADIDSRQANKGNNS
jgi:hypothetical protein